MIWTLIINSHNSWYINYIEKKLIQQIENNNLSNFVEVVVFETKLKINSKYISIIDNIEISDNYIIEIYNIIINSDSDCIGLSGSFFIKNNSYSFTNCNTENLIYIPISQMNPIKLDLIKSKYKNIYSYINCTNISEHINSVEYINKPLVFFEKVIQESYSIIITAYNASKYIEECLDSIENQTYFKDNDNYEILIGVDGCQDTLDTLNSIKNKFRNLKIYMMNSNKGTYITTNTLITLAKYNNIIRFDSDDIMDKNLVSTVAYNKKDYDIVVLGYVNFEDDKISNRLELGGIVYFKKEIMKIAGGYQPWICAADTELLIRLSNVVKISYLNKAVFYRRIHKNSLTNNSVSGYNTELRNKYSSLIKSSYNNDEIKIERIINSNYIYIKSEKYNLIYMISTYNRLKFLKKTIDTWYKTCNKKHNWTLIIADDGSNDGTLEYLYNLKYENIKILIIENKRRGIHHQTNSILKVALNLDFDYGFKSDDDIIFLKKNWDDLYLNASIKTCYYHLIFYDKEWGNRRKELKETLIKNNLLENSVLPQNIQGAFWTFNKDVINNVGFFDTSIYNLCGLGHVDYSLRCCRLGYNDINNPYDIINSNSFITLNKEKYISHNNFNSLWNTQDIINNKKNNLFKNRNYIEYNELNINLLGEDINNYDISFIIPLRNRNDHIKGLEFNINNMFNKYKYEIIYVNQDDDKLFKRGQLCNIGFKESKGQILVFQDVDIRHLNYINIKELLNEYKKPFVAFDSITQLNENEIGIYDIIENEKRLCGYGACSIFNREQFIISGGFSNLIFGWGVEDTIMNDRVNEYERYNQSLGHVYHFPLRKDSNIFNSIWYKNNKFIWQTNSDRDKYKDGYIQTLYNKDILQTDNIKIINVNEIYVPDNYEYIELYEKIKN